MKNILILSIFILLGNFLKAQCPTATFGSAPIEIVDLTKTQQFSLLQGSGVQCDDSTVDAEWEGTPLGTINNSNCNGFNITLTRQDGISTIKYTFKDTFPTPSNNVSCTYTIATYCDPVEPNITPTFTCGSSTIAVEIDAILDPISELMIPEVTNGEMVSINENPNNPFSKIVIFSVDNGCDALSFGYHYTTPCGDWGGDWTVNKESDNEVGTIEGESVVCIQTGPKTKHYDLDVQNIEAGCVHIRWSVQKPGEDDYVTLGSVADYNGLGRDLLLDLTGTYTIKAEVYACGGGFPSPYNPDNPNNPEPIRVEHKTVRTCDDVPQVPEPPMDLECISSSDGVQCYTWNNIWCISAFEVSTTDSKLNVYSQGTTICVSDILHSRRSRISNLTVTPIGICGAGPTADWDIYINSDDCGEDDGDFGETVPPQFPGGFPTRIGNVEPFGIQMNSTLLSLDLEINSEQDPTKDIELYDISGRLLEGISTTSSSIQLDSGRLPKGLIIVRMRFQGKQYVEKMMNY